MVEEEEEAAAEAAVAQVALAQAPQGLYQDHLHLLRPQPDTLLEQRLTPTSTQLLVELITLSTCTTYQEIIITQLVTTLLSTLPSTTTVMAITFITNSMVTTKIVQTVMAQMELKKEVVLLESSLSSLLSVAVLVFAASFPNSKKAWRSQQLSRRQWLLRKSCMMMMDQANMEMKL